MISRRLRSFLERHPLVGLDTSVFIYQLEGGPPYQGAVHEVFTWLHRPRSRAVTSTITMVELLVAPYRVGDVDRVNSFFALLSTYPHLEWLAPSLEIADSAARLRAEYGLRTPDAIQVATAAARGARGFISNDSALRKVRQLDVLLVDELVTGT